MGTEKYLEKMQEDIELRGLAENLRIRYGKSVEQFLSRCSKPVEELDEEDVREYSLELMEAGVKASTFNIHQAGIRFFFAVTLNRSMNYLQMSRFKEKRALPEILRDYWRAYRPQHPEGWLFVGLGGHAHTTRGAVSLALEKWLKEAGISRHVTIHSLRHAFASYLLEDGVDIFTIKELMGHRSITSTTLYLRLVNLKVKTASETVLELCADKKYLGAKPGITAVLHTWGQNLQFHPHIHMVATGGGLTPDGKWRASKKKFFLPGRVLSAKFRGKFLALFKRKFSDADQGLLDACYRKKWVVYCKPPFGSAEKVVSYLGRYIHRVAISKRVHVPIAFPGMTARPAQQCALHPCQQGRAWLRCT